MAEHTMADGGIAGAVLTGLPLPFKLCRLDPACRIGTYDCSCA